MTPATTHPLTTAWLRDLELLLHGVDPGERAEVLAGVHEHLDATLPPGSTDADVRRVLAELGSPQSVADEAYAGRPSPVSTEPVVGHAGPAWPGVAATALNAVCIALVVLGFSSGVAHLSEVLFSFVVLQFPWFAVVACSILASRWTTREKAASIALMPAAVAVLSLLLWMTFTVGTGILVNGVFMVAFVAAVSWALVRLGRSAVR